MLDLLKPEDYGHSEKQNALEEVFYSTVNYCASEIAVKWSDL